MFLIGDAVACAKAGQKVAEGFYNIQLMLDRVRAQQRRRWESAASCMDARGIGVTELSAGAERSSMDELAQWTQWADKVLVF